MPKSYGQSFLGEISSKLGRILGIDGRIPTDLPDNVILAASINVGDANLPGMADRQGKRFALSLASGASQAITIVANPNDRGVIVEHLVVWNLAVNGTFSLNWLDVATATGAGAATRLGQVLDSSQLDNPPVLSAVGNAALGTSVLGTSLITGAAITPAFTLPIAFYIAPGCGIQIRHGGVGGQLSGMMYGRLF